jgi:hypothetical protein
MIVWRKKKEFLFKLKNITSHSKEICIRTQLNRKSKKMKTFPGS